MRPLPAGKCAAKFMASSLRSTGAVPGACDANDEVGTLRCSWPLSIVSGSFVCILEGSGRRKLDPKVSDVQTVSLFHRYRIYINFCRRRKIALHVTQALFLYIHTFYTYIQFVKFTEEACNA